MSSRRALVGLVLVVCAGVGIVAQRATSAPPARTNAAATPKLLVLVVIDQFRYDYIDMYGTQWTSGLKRIVTGGARFINARYPYGFTVTCPGHATIGTGAYPERHGMVANTWYDRTLKKVVACAEDASVTSVPFGGGTGKEHHSPASLLIPNFADEFRRQASHTPNIVSVALKPRSAITMGGHASPTTTVVWEEDDGTWATSDAYAKTPWPDVDAFVRAHPIPASFGEMWTLLMPKAAYRFVDDGPGEARPAPWGRTFPHTLHSVTGNPDNAYTTTWERSPHSDAFVADLAASLVESRHLGSGPGTDMLALSLPALDLVGHEYGPNSWEVQDILMRADRDIGRVLDAVERAVGRNGYLLAFSADHGIATLPERGTAAKVDAGRVAAADVTVAARTVLAKYLGEGTHVGATDGGLLYLTPGSFDKLRATPGAIDAVKTALSGVKGVSRVYSADDLASKAPSSDACLTAWKKSYVPGRTADFSMIPKPNWIFRGTGTTHGSCNSYDQRVPVILYGAGVVPGIYPNAASPADIVPTFASVVGITLPNAQGRALSEAIKR